MTTTKRKTTTPNKQRGYGFFSFFAPGYATICLLQATADQSAGQRGGITAMDSFASLQCEKRPQ